jgi:LTXXQ motif family protein
MTAAVLEDTMKTSFRLALPVLAVLAFSPAVQAQSDPHQRHHPGGQAQEVQDAPAPGSSMPMPMPMPMRGMDMNGMPMGGQGGGSMDCPMMGAMRRNAGMGMGMPFEHIEGRIAFLQTEIGITEGQREQWNAFAEALRKNAEVHRSMHDQMMAPKASPQKSWLQTMQGKARMMSSHAEALKAVEATAGPLYAVLTEDQRQKADGLLAGAMGMM